MESKTLQALRESIAHWKRARDERENEPVGRHTCPLCHLFYGDPFDGEDRCCGCPIFERTGFPRCGNTPYIHDEQELYDMQANVEDVSDAEWRRLAQAEVDFLKSLLPVEQQTTNEMEQT